MLSDRRKRMIYLITRLSQVLRGMIFLDGNAKQKRIVCYPVFTDRKRLLDQINRINWYLPTGSNVEIYIPITAELSDVLLEEYTPPKYHRVPPSKGAKKVFITEKDVKKHIKKATIINVWDMKSDWFKMSNWRIDKVRIGDPDFYLFAETHTYPGLVWHDLWAVDKKRHEIKKSKDLFSKMRRELTHYEKVYIFGTGPSIEGAEKRDYSDGIRIICNSIVKNKQLLDHLNPHIVCFTDSVFHFGVSSYAGEFAKDLIRVIKKHNCYGITNQVGYAVMVANYPELEGKLMCIPAKRHGGPNILSEKNYHTRDYANILTRYMLPLAGGLAKDQIVLQGFDGRNPDENYFWKHNENNQYVDEMESTQVLHPAFFRDISYSEYYDKHCHNIELIVKLLENQKKRVRVIGNSYIPILMERVMG